VPQDVIPAYPADIVLRAIPGPQEEAFGRGLDTFFESRYDITPESDRMGCRLQGPPIHHDEGFPQSIISEPTIPGNVQVPADGQPIILLVEQTTGGYTKIATVISSDISKIAQAVPGNRVRFRRVSLDEAHRTCREQALRMREIEARLSPIR
jgi:allophanate hydrolase subunit 2